MKLLLASLVFATLGLAQTQAPALKLADLPPAVRTAVEAELRTGYTIDKIKSKAFSGQPAFEVEFERKGKEREILYKSSGEVIQIEETMELKDVPAPALDAMRKAAKGGKLRKADRIERAGKVYYEGELEIAGKRSSLLFDAKGNRVED